MTGGAQIREEEGCEKERRHHPLLAEAAEEWSVQMEDEAQVNTEPRR
jgi:hypothetical protein